jgi:large subunit ribosomal protein L12
MEYIYAALLLHKLGKAIDEASVSAVVKAASHEVDEAKVRALVASLKGVDIDKELLSAAAMPVAASAAAIPEKEEKKEEKKEEASAEGLAALFG